MLAIKGLFDGEQIKSLEPIPVRQKYIVAITFIEPLEKDQSKLLDYANLLDANDVNLFEKILDERNDFFKGREIDP